MTNKQTAAIETYPGHSPQEWRGRFASETIEWVEPDQLLAHPDNQRSYDLFTGIGFLPICYVLDYFGSGKHRLILQAVNK